MFYPIDSKRRCRQRSHKAIALPGQGLYNRARISIVEQKNSLQQDNTSETTQVLNDLTHITKQQSTKRTQDE